MRRTCGRIHEIKVVNLDQQIDQFDRLLFAGKPSVVGRNL
jgi:hypothetical protein